MHGAHSQRTCTTLEVPSFVGVLHTVQYPCDTRLQALPWMTVVREKLEDPQWWGFFLHKKDGTPQNATTALYHDFLQTEPGDCGSGVECGEVRKRKWCSSPYAAGRACYN